MAEQSEIDVKEFSFKVVCGAVQRKLTEIRSTDKKPRAWIFSVIDNELRVRDAGSDKSIKVLSVDRQSFEIVSGIPGISLKGTFTFKDHVEKNFRVRLKIISEYFEENYYSSASLDSSRS